MILPQCILGYALASSRHAISSKNYDQIIEHDIFFTLPYQGYLIQWDKIFLEVLYENWRDMSDIMIETILSWTFSIPLKKFPYR